MATPDVIIDGTVPRSPKERVAHLLVYADGYVELNESGRVSATERQCLEETRQLLEQADEDYEFWHEVEDDLIGAINTAIDDAQVCTLGEANPGDVIVREVGHPSEEMV